MPIPCHRARFSCAPLIFATFATSATLATALSLSAADTAFTPYMTAKPVLDAYRAQLPDALQNADASNWNAWTRTQDKAIRARLEQGDLDSMVNLLLFGTSFTKQARIRIENLTEASRSGVLRGRVDDLVLGLRNPMKEERLIFLARLLREKGLDPGGASPDIGVFIYKNLQRVVKERAAIAKRAAEAKRASESILDRSSLFRDRGVSLDTAILPDFALDQTLRDLKKRGVLREGRVLRVGVIGPGLDFIDKNEESGYDYYPQQTVQPFALYDSLLRLGLAPAGGLSISILDISPRVIDHVQRARERARKNIGYTIQLPRDVDRPWSPELVNYWRALGDQIGAAVQPIRPPEIFQGLETRAVLTRPEVVLACEPVDLDIVLELVTLPAGDRFDLVVGTNIFLYYDAFEQTLALENIGAMLKPGGLLLTNDKLPEIPGGAMRQAGITTLRYNERDPGAVEAVGWYRKN